MGKRSYWLRVGAEIFAVSPHCTHYNGPLAEGSDRRQDRALPLASRLFRSAHRRGSSRTGAQPDHVLGSGAKMVG